MHAIIKKHNFSKESNNKSNISNKTSKSNSSFKLLIREDYSWYIKILKRIYISFKSNHYKAINNEYYENYKKYREEGYINNRNFGKSLSEDFNYKIKKVKSTYKKSN